MRTRERKQSKRTETRAHKESRGVHIICRVIDQHASVYAYVHTNTHIHLSTCIWIYSYLSIRIVQQTDEPSPRKRQQISALAVIGL